jgi:hypothetical protein
MTCGRCGITDRSVRDTIANLEREHREDGVLHKAPQYAIEPRCPDKDACRERVQRARRTPA